MNAGLNNVELKRKLNDDEIVRQKILLKKDDNYQAQKHDIKLREMNDRRMETWRVKEANVQLMELKH